MDSNRKFSIKIHGNDYAVEIKKVDDGVASVDVNGTVYEVQYEAERRSSKTPTLVRQPVLMADKVLPKITQSELPFWARLITPMGTPF